MRELRAGRVTAELHGADLRDVRAGDVVLAQRIYVAVRDEVWNTIPGELSDVEVEQGDGFRVALRSRHRHRDIDFEWRGEIAGGVDGAISYALDGRARSAFRYAKIGFNVHHPLRECAGRPWRTRAGEGRLPVEVVPQRVEDGRLTALFPEYDHLELDLEGGVVVRFDFDGDLFELQDHRNWLDGNFKTYGTPMSVPWPFDAQEGQELRQRVTVSFAGDPPERRAGPVRVRVGGGLGRTLPPLGLGHASHGGALGERERRLLLALSPDHLRVDLRPPWTALPGAVEAARALGTQLELALHLDPAEAEAELAALEPLLAGLPVARVLVFERAEGFSAGAGSTRSSLVRRAKERLRAAAGDAPFVGGTDGFFADLNRDRPEREGLDGAAWSANPQVHACDDRSLFEGLAAFRPQLDTARSFLGGLPLHVTPVTLHGRYGPYPAGPPAADGLPGNVDTRQATPIAAAWTLGALKELAEGGAASVTLFETTGWLGVVERDEGNPRPDLFPSRPGATFPVYDVLRELRALRGEELREALSDDPLRVAALAAGDGLVLANLTPRDLEVEVDGRTLALRGYEVRQP